ncbi:MAG: MscS Mechanosensitive ion channel [Rickettsiaceae bacterium]|jgi:MscS family membrane protein|nr:MscS Mechanosensitive ion channel [Rickettsiaceae bacterium]
MLGLPKEVVWIVEILAVVAGALLASFVIGYVLEFFQKKLAHNKTIWDDLTLSSAKSPLKVFVWIMAAIAMIKIGGARLRLDPSHEIYLLKNLGIIFCLSWFFWRLIKKYEKYLKRSSEEHSNDTLNISTILKALKIVVVLIAAIMLMDVAGVSVSGLVAFGGAGGIIAGLAAKDLLANFFGSMMIYFDRPFVVGDWIRSPDRKIEGVVEHIGWRLTHVRTFDKRMIYVPNSIFSTLIVENPSRMTHRHIHETVRIRYEDIDKIDNIISQIKRMINNHEGIDKSCGILVNLSKFGESSVELFVDAFTSTKKWAEYSAIKQDILLKISDVIRRNQAGLAG